MTILPWTFFLVLFCVPILTESKRQPGVGRPDKPRQPPPSVSPPAVAKRPRNRSVPGSGELTTKDGHSCVWQTSGEGLVTLMVNCTTETLGETQRYWCRYAGKPDLCAAYGVKSSPYWKQLVGKLKKRLNACDGDKVLKAKTCKKAPAEAHMWLKGKSGDGERKTTPKDPTKKKERSKTVDGVKAEKKKGEEKDEMDGFGDEGMVNDMQQTYCSDGWHSVCSFFVNFFEG